MKKIISVILLLAIALSLCACGSNTDVQAYKDEIKALQQRIDELEELLISEGIEFDSETESVSGETDNAEE